MRVKGAITVMAAVGALGCARIEPPPGGAPDPEPPQLVATRPDSFARLPDFDGHVEFQFDEVISEGGSPNQGTGTGDLEKLVILSPSDRVPSVSWRRTRIAVRPDEGWKPNRVYRVELLPGTTDLRRNRSAEGAVLTFTTGAPLPATTIQGTVVDWTTGRPAPAALVEAILMPDSLPYRGLADSSGRIEFGPLPAGDYIVRGILDENRNLRPDPREAYD
ncbi:MAG: Ig-like domain-containing protein, partial [Gemmatimonadota bacterium]|nr:Ig-like domain-containing protein [Gemmatimonadota bacterium]